MITIERHGDVFILVMDSGENRFNEASVAEFNAAFDEVEHADGPRALVTTGVDKFFSNGLDLDYMGGLDDVRPFLRSVLQLLGRTLVLPVISVAAINGHAFAGGAMFAAAHDQKIMRTGRGYYCIPEVDLGMRFAPGMNWLLKDKLPPAACHEAMTTGRRYPAEDALTAGIIDAVAPEQDLLAMAVARAEPLASKAGGVLASIKRDLYPTTVELLEAGRTS